MRKFKTFCFNCGKETRNKGIGIKPIDVCSSCIKEAESERKRKLNKLSEDDLRKYLTNLQIDKIPKGNSRFRCKKHKNILSYVDIVSGCYSCIMDDAHLQNGKTGGLLSSMEENIIIV